MSQLAIAVVEQSQVGEARRVAVRLAEAQGFDEVAAGQVALVVTELATNLARHAQKGSVLISTRALASGASALDILALDHGPGMADVDLCLRDGYSTGGTPGTGLGAAKRLSSEFSVHSAPGRGTVIAASVWSNARPVAAGAAPAALAPDAPAAFEYAAVCLPAPGETVSGDSWSVRVEGDKAYAMVADGLGHGPSAAEASLAAISVFEHMAGSPKVVLERAHELMRSTRGAAVAMAELDARAGTVLISGAGNIVGRLVSGVDDRTLLSQHGTLGVQIRRLTDMNYPWSEHALLVLHSDGITSRWNFDDASSVLQCSPAVIAGWIMREHRRGRDDATVLVMRRSRQRPHAR